MTSRTKIRGVMHHPWIIKDVIHGNSKEGMQNKLITLEQQRLKKEALQLVKVSN